MGWNSDFEYRFPFIINLAENSITDGDRLTCLTFSKEVETIAIDFNKTSTNNLVSINWLVKLPAIRIKSVCKYILKKG